MNKLPAPRKLGKEAASHVTKERRRVMANINYEERKRTSRKRARLDWRQEHYSESSGRDVADVRRAWSDSFIKAIRRRINAQHAMSGLNVGLHIDVIEGDEVMSAFTDFNSISLGLPGKAIPTYDTPYADVADYIDTARGAYHHEAGHILYTVPLWNIAVTPFYKSSDPFDKSSDPISASGLAAVSKAWGKIVKQTQKLIGGDDDSINRAVNLIQRTWNFLEDQRMESARVRDYPAATRHFQTMVKTVVMNTDRMDLTWLLLAGREYMPEEVRAASAESFVFDPQEWLGIVNRYKAATDEEELFDTVVDAWIWLSDRDVDQLWPGSAYSHSAIGKEGCKANTEKGATEGSGTLPSQGSGKKTFTTEEFKDLLNNTIAPTVDTAVMKRVGDAMKEFGRPDFYTQGTRSMTSEEVAAKDALRNGIRKALETYLTEASPRWEERQEEGFLVPIDYRLRERGEYDYNHLQTGNTSSNKLGLRLSLMLDNSGSMSSVMPEVSVVAVATAQACTDLGVEHNVVLWSNEGATYRLFRNGANNEVFPSGGGTEPDWALREAFGRIDDSNRHLVVFLTDGAWAGVDAIDTYRSGNEHAILVQMGSVNDKLKGFDKKITINKISDFPNVIKSALIGMAGGKV